MATIELDVVTPNGRALEAKVDELTIPGQAGDFGILPGHLPVISGVRSGIVAYRAGGDQKYCAIGRGFARVSETACSLVVDDYVAKEAVDPVLVRKELIEVNRDLDALMAREMSSGDDADSLVKLTARQNWLAVLLELHGDAPFATIQLKQDGGVVSAELDETAGLDVDTETP